MSVPVDGAQAAVHQLSTCLVDVEAWLKASRLRLNPAITQVMCLGSQHLLSIVSSCIRVQKTAHDLGVLSTTDCLWASKTLVQAFLASHLDYSNAMLFDITNELLCRLQYTQNAAARLVTGAKRSDHISPVLCQLHWLPVCRAARGV